MHEPDNKPVGDTISANQPDAESAQSSVEVIYTPHKNANETEIFLIYNEENSFILGEISNFDAIIKVGIEYTSTNGNWNFNKSETSSIFSFEYKSHLFDHGIIVINQEGNASPLPENEAMNEDSIEGVNQKFSYLESKVTEPTEVKLWMEQSEAALASADDRLAKINYDLDELLMRIGA